MHAFLDGGIQMWLETIILVLALLAAWKKPSIIGLLQALSICVCVLFLAYDYFLAGEDIQQVGEIATSVLWGGIKVTLLCPMYTMLINILLILIRIGLAFKKGEE